MVGSIVGKKILVKYIAQLFYRLKFLILYGISLSLHLPKFRSHFQEKIEFVLPWSYQEFDPPFDSPRRAEENCTFRFFMISRPAKIFLKLSFECSLFYHGQLFPCFASIKHVSP